MIEIALEHIPTIGIAMTRPLQKEHERFFVERAAEFLGKIWTLEDCECPDFIVTEGAQKFGLEVRDLFTGKQSGAGSHLKRTESVTQQAVDALRHDYEATTNIPLSVRFVGDMCNENIAKVVPILVAKNLSSKPIGHQDVIDIDAGERLRVHVTRAYVAGWFYVNHRVGWVDRDPIKRIADAIEEKSRNLPRYWETAGPDIRLLIVADHIYNSGKLMLEERAAPALQGFQVMYFFSYPQSVKVFGCAGNSA